ncbi:MAG: VOC family protein [Acidimicrobiales bacterium]|jgi:catechol 2,3-dioxygenase-like lactoylglutathione lyase family enzyme
MTPLAPHYHVGIVVPDLGAARAQFTEQLGVSWGPVLDLPQVEYRDSSGQDLVLPTRFCYSAEDPHLELIEEVPGSVWSCNEHSNLHHIGFWSDDLPAESARLDGIGCPLQLCGRAGADAPVSFAYHGNEFGVRIEVVATAMREAMSFLFLPDGS